MQFILFYLIQENICLSEYTISDNSCNYLVILSECLSIHEAEHQHIDWHYTWFDNNWFKIYNIQYIQYTV